MPICRVAIPRGAVNIEALTDHEWLLTNGVGGYSSGTLTGAISRRYHGLLVAALPNPIGRTVMLNTVVESLPAESIRRFELDGGIPVWWYEIGDATVRKRIVMPHRQNTVVIEYSVSHARAPVALRLAPAVHFRGYEAPVSEPLHDTYVCERIADHYEIGTTGLPPLRIATEGAVTFTRREERRDQIMFAVEEARGFRARGGLWSPGTFAADLSAGESIALIASTEPVDVASAMSAAEMFDLEHERKRRLLSLAAASATHGDVEGQLVIAADQFIIQPVGRVRDTLRALAVGDELRTVVAGYHWFTDWGRDTMISLEGLTLATGRHREAAFILRTFAHYVRDGLIPNLFPDGSDEGLYHTADATLWFFHAVDRYTRVSGDDNLVRAILPTMRAIVEAHMRGTRFAIGVDPMDGLLRQGAEGYQLTWMDAKVDGWVVTARRGKAVEINALWYNALCLLSRWERDFGDAERSHTYTAEARRVRASFNRRFWNPKRGYLFDVVDGPDGDDDACRPNQIFSISLPNPVLDDARWGDVLGVVREKLLTPVGLRSLSPDHPDYKSRYFGDLRARDAAYHQGTVWAWLIGPWIDAWLRLHPADTKGARSFLDGLIAHIPEFGVGSIAEIFDAEEPFTPRGCIAQAWSVAEVLRCLGGLRAVG